MIGQTELTVAPQRTQPSYIIRVHYISTYTRNLRQQWFCSLQNLRKFFRTPLWANEYFAFSLVLTFSTSKIVTTLKSLRERGLFILIKIDLHLLKVALIFLSKILLSRCVDYFIKGIKKIVPHALLSYISTKSWKLLRTLEKCKQHLPTARASPNTSVSCS